MNINLSEELEQRLKSLPNLDNFAEQALQQALIDYEEGERPLTELEKEFINRSVESAKNGGLMTHEETMQFFRNNGVDC